MSEHTHLRQQRERLPMIDAMLALLGTLVVTSAACLWIAVETPVAGRAAVIWLGGASVILLGVASAIAVYGIQSARHVGDRYAVLAADISQLADWTLPALASRLREGVSVDAVLAELPHPADQAYRRVLRTVGQEIMRSERMRAAATSACANAAGRVQALTTSMLADLREMESRHSEEVLGDLLKLDHSTAQAGRLADSIAVLTGARSGRRWTKPIVMESILRGAMSRINAYQRVRVHSTSTVAVAGYAAEGVMHALAEIMDNATSFSPPAEEVHVYVEEVQAGVVITVEDGGLVMSPAALRRAERAVSAEPLDLTTLSGTRLGLAVVGCLARKHGLGVFFRPSSRGGTGVVVMIPRQLIIQADQEPAPRALPGGVVVPAEPAAETEAAPETDRTPAGLPQRRRGHTLAAAPATRVSAQPKPAPARSDAGARFGAFRQASRGQGAYSQASSPGEDGR
jgi:signal transduction histidine kinase